MISPKNKFIFVHVPKTAGRSVRRALRPHCYTVTQEISRLLDPVRTILGRPVSPFPKSRYSPLRGHPAVSEYRKFFGDEYDEYFTFAFVRNPFDWLVSYYEWSRSRELGSSRQEKFAQMEFSSFIDWACDGGLRTQHSLLRNSNGEVDIDYLGHFETIQTDFARIAKRIGIANHLPHRNKSPRGSTEFYFSDREVAAVQNYFGADFKYFGYEFSLPASQRPK